MVGLTQFRWMGRLLVEGDESVAGPPLVLSEPLSLWGGLEPVTGAIIDQRHPAVGQIVTGRVLILPSGRGSSSASSILLEAIRLGTAPLAIVTAELDGILALGGVVAQQIYGRTVPILTLAGEDYAALVTAVAGYESSATAVFMRVEGAQLSLLLADVGEEQE